MQIQEFKKELIELDQQIKKEIREAEEQNERLRENIKHIELFKKSMKFDRKDVIRCTISEMLELPFDEYENLDYNSYVSIIYHLDYNLYEKLRNLVYEIKNKINLL